MYSDARTLQEVGIEDTVPMLREALDQAGLEFDEIDYFIRIRRPRGRSRKA